MPDDIVGWMGWRVLGDDRKVAIVVEPDFRDDLLAIAEKHPVWIVETDQNWPRIEAAWKVGAQMNLCYINKYPVDDASDREDSLTGILDSVDDHHGEYSKGGGYDGLIVHGLARTPLVREKLAKLGFEIGDVTEDGFIALGVLQEAVYPRHFSEI